MKIELLTSQPVPCTRHTAFAGMEFDVTQAMPHGYWFMHMGHSVFVPRWECREITPETKQAEFISNRAILSRSHTRTLRGFDLTRVSFIFVLFVSFVVKSQAATVVTDQFLNTLAKLESNHNPAAVGDHGRARGEFQLWRCAWDQVNSQRLASAPYSQATNRATARLYATAYLRILEARLAKTTGRAPAPAELYAAWNLGPTRFHQLSYNLRKAPATTRKNARLVAAEVKRLSPRRKP
jgi:hypothetical protein